MKQYIKKFFILLIVWALLLDTTTVFAISAITANRMEKTISNKVDDTQRSKIEKDNLKRLSNKEGSDNKSVNQVSIDKPLINSSILDGDGVIEDKSKRTLYSRTIQNEEGKYRVEQSLFPIFKEVNGEFVDIDNSFINKRSNGLYSNSLSLDNKIVMDIISSNKSNLKIIFEEDNENESDIEGNVAKINQSNNYNNYEIINEDYLINTKINVKRNNNSLYYELDEVNSYSISESNIMINDGEFTIFPIYYQDLYLKTEIVKKDDKKFLRIDTSKVKEENFIFELKIGVNPIKKSLARISSSLNLSGYKYSNTNTNLPDESIVNTDLNVGYDKSANPAPHLRSYVTFTKPTLSNSYGAIEKAQLKYKIQVEAGSQNINVNMSSTSIKPTDVTWNNRNNYTWQKIGAGTRNNDGTYSFNVLTYLNHLKNNGNQRTLEFKGYEGTDYNRLDLYSTNVKLIVDYEYDFASNSKLTTSLRAHSKGRGEVASISFVGIGAPTKNVTYTLKTYDKKGNTINAKTKNTPNFTKTASKKKIIPTFISKILVSEKVGRYYNMNGKTN
ncbi:hypothetical protein OKW22_000291 [Bacilli bacterium PM5-3]|nr:hypothetical protein [Bacilli bacterium PM5-3]